MKEAEEIFKYIVEEIHSIIMATVDEKIDQLHVQ